MAEPRGASLAETLDELCAAVAADAGAALYLDDGDGLLQLAGSAGHPQGRPPGLISRLRGRSSEANGRTLMLKLDPNGVLVLARSGGIDFTQQDRAVARLYSRRLTGDTAATGGTVRRNGWTRQLEAIQRIAARLTRLASVSEVGAAVCSEIREVIDYDEAQLLVVGNTAALELVAAIGGPRDAAGTPLPLPAAGAGGDALARAAHGGIPVIVPALSDPGPGRPAPASLLLVPLRYEGRVSGVIALIATGAGRFDDDDLRLLQILSDQAAVAIENARLLHGRDQLVQELAALLEISEAAGGASDETELARLTAARIRRATGADACVISRWDEDSTVLRVLWREGIDGPGMTVDLVDSPIRWGVLRDGRPLIVQAESAETSAQAAAEAQALGELGAQTLVLLPLTAGGRTVGLVELISAGAALHLSEPEIQACEAMASLAATGIEKVRLLQQLRSAADIDLVTAVHNHRYLQERLRQEVARSARSHSPFGLLMLDLDRFKPVNDQHGHADGDRVLHNIGATIKDHVRTTDIVARYGGDEFVVLMPDTPPDHAEHVARRVVAGILQRRHVLSDGSQVGVGVSAGLAVYPADGRTPAQLLLAADAAMYSAKRSGGRQIERSRSPGPLVAVPAPVAG